MTSSILRTLAVALLAGSLLIVSHLSHAQFHDLDWAVRYGGMQNDVPGFHVTDANGNIYPTGGYSGAVDFDPGPGETILPDDGTSMYLTKFDASGTLVYAAGLSLNTALLGNGSAAVDPSGRMYRTGVFDGTVDFDPGVGTVNVACPDSSCMFLLRLDASGLFDYVETFDASGGEVEPSRSMIDANGDHVVLGTFRGTVDFDPGPGVVDVTSQSSASSERDLFVLKLDADGNFINVETLGGPANLATIDAIATDASGSIFIGGTFRETMDFDPGPAAAEFTATGIFSGYLVKLNASGDFVWARVNGGAGLDTVNSLAVDSAGSIYATGYFREEVDFNPGSGSDIFTGTSGSFDLFVQKFDAAGGVEFVFALGGDDDAFFQADGAFVDSFDNLHAAGAFMGSLDFDPGPGQRILRSGGTPGGSEPSGFYTVFDSAGRLRSLSGLAGNLSVTVGSIGAGSSGRTVLMGQFEGTADFDPGPGTGPLTSAGGADIYVASLARNNAVFSVAPGLIEEGDPVMVQGPIGTNYQWLKDGVPVADDPPRVTGASTYALTFENVLESDAGTYRVQYENGAKAVVVSEPYVLTVNPPGALPVTNAWALRVLALVLVVSGIRLMVGMNRGQLL